ncbi:peroxiredoxin [Lyngbya confervoides]|uniref:thioredoxin-dependent peroxiredoxin n=1 Tax=Lyngbya confervoides BDU141951 TaxID=1574623 RepID=A0ABD4T1T4_9CYAN|nr:peroxiredoxin [Lyngbya confervoides]MCM1982682.1 peroxiredoxin [Lyngbya confervoides BDU141951]
MISLVLVLCCWLPGPSAWALGGALPALNQPAPGFSLPAQTGEGTLALSDYLGQWVVLYFYPQDFTPGCTLEAQRFQKDLESYRARNAQILGVSADSADVHAEFCDSEQLTFPLLADEEGTVSRAYGSWLGNQSLRHTFLIDPQGKIRDRFVKVQPAVHSQEVLEALDQLLSDIS